MEIIVGLIVSNRHGVLYRIAGLYSKRGFNINSLSVGETENPLLSRMTIVSTGDARTREQIVKQLRKLPDVKAVATFDGRNAVSIELILAKIKGIEAEKVKALGGQILHENDGCIVAQIAGSGDVTNTFIDGIGEDEIIELCRTGIVSLETDMVLLT